MNNNGLTLEIPSAVLEGAKLPEKEIEDEFRKELALALYQRGVLSSGKARLLARMTRWQFEELLGKRRIERHYTAKDLQEDIQYGLGHQSCFHVDPPGKYRSARLTEGFLWPDSCPSRSMEGSRRSR